MPVLTSYGNPRGVMRKAVEKMEQYCERALREIDDGTMEDDVTLDFLNKWLHESVAKATEEMMCAKGMLEAREAREEAE